MIDLYNLILKHNTTKPDIQARITTIDRLLAKVGSSL